MDAELLQLAQAGVLALQVGAAPNWAEIAAVDRRQRRCWPASVRLDCVGAEALSGLSLAKRIPSQKRR